MSPFAFLFFCSGEEWNVTKNGVILCENSQIHFTNLYAHFFFNTMWHNFFAETHWFRFNACVKLLVVDSAIESSLFTMLSQGYNCSDRAFVVRFLHHLARAVVVTRNTFHPFYFAVRRKWKLCRNIIKIDTQEEWIWTENKKSSSRVAPQKHSSHI